MYVVWVQLLEASAADGMLRTLDTLRRPLLLADMGARGWPCLHANEAWLKHMGARRSLFSSLARIMMWFSPSQ